MCEERRKYILVIRIKKYIKRLFKNCIESGSMPLFFFVPPFQFFFFGGREEGKSLVRCRITSSIHIRKKERKKQCLSVDRTGEKSAKKKKKYIKQYM